MAQSANNAMNTTLWGISAAKTALPTKLAASAANLMALPAPASSFAVAVTLFGKDVAPAVDQAHGLGMLLSVDDSSVSPTSSVDRSRREPIAAHVGSIFRRYPLGEDALTRSP